VLRGDARAHRRARRDRVRSQRAQRGPRKASPACANPSISAPLLLEGDDSLADGRARFVPHTGFQHPACPPDAPLRESIEARTLVVFRERLAH